MPVKRTAKRPTKKTTTKKTVKKAAAKKVVKKPASKKTVTKKAAAKKTSVQKPTNGKSVAKKPSPSAGVSTKVFSNFKKSVEEALTVAFERIDLLQMVQGGFDPRFTSIDDNGGFKLNLEEADRENLREWAWRFGYEFFDEDTEAIRSGLIEARDSDGFGGFIDERNIEDLENEGEGEEVEAEAAEEEAEEGSEEEGESEEGDVSPAELLEHIPSLNWSALTDVADQMELDYSDIAKPPQTKVLRNRISEALQAMIGDDEGEEAEEEEAEEEEGWAVDSAIKITHEGDVYDAIFKDFDEDGDVLFVWEEGGEQQCVSADVVELA